MFNRKARKLETRIVERLKLERSLFTIRKYNRAIATVAVRYANLIGF